MRSWRGCRSRRSCCGPTRAEAARVVDSVSLLTPERLLRHLQWRVVRRLEGRLQGDFRTLLRGNGTDFLGLRLYEWGDDVRHIDWNVTARMDELYVREYAEDRDLTAWLLLDRSRSMAFGAADRTKELVLAELAGVVRSAPRTRRQPHWDHRLRRRRDLPDPAGTGARPGTPAARAAPTARQRRQGDRPVGPSRGGVARRAPPLAGRVDLRLHQPAGVGAAAGPPHRTPRGGRGPDGGPP